jgi:DNA-binding MarR family transcriptional regulator
MYFLVEMKVLELIPKEGPISVKELADIIKIDESAIGGDSHMDLRRLEE